MKPSCKVTHGSNGVHGSAPCYDPDILFGSRRIEVRPAYALVFQVLSLENVEGGPTVVVLDKPCTEKRRTRFEGDRSRDPRRLSFLMDKPKYAGGSSSPNPKVIDQLIVRLKIARVKSKKQINFIAINLHC